MPIMNINPEGSITKKVYHILHWGIEKALSMCQKMTYDHFKEHLAFLHENIVSEERIKLSKQPNI